VSAIVKVVSGWLVNGLPTNLKQTVGRMTIISPNYAVGKMRYNRRKAQFEGSRDMSKKKQAFTAAQNIQVKGKP